MAIQVLFRIVFQNDGYEYRVDTADLYAAATEAALMLHAATGVPIHISLPAH